MMTTKNPDRYNLLSSQLADLLKKIDQAERESDYPRNWLDHPGIKELYLEIVGLDTEIASGEANGQDVKNLQKEMDEAIAKLKKIPEFTEFLNHQHNLTGLWKEFNSLIMGEPA